MADTHGQNPAPHDDHDTDHATAPEEDAMRTPAWLTYVGLALLVVGALSSYLWIYPGTMNAAVVSDDGGVEGGADASAAEGGAPAAAPTPAPTQ